jgi:large subunit ribosomal protein L17
MNKRLSTQKLGRTKSHREALVKNQLRSLFTYGFVVTTTPKAKVLRTATESFLNKAKEENLETKRYLYMMLGKKSLVEKASEYVKKTKNKVSIVKVDFRDGDAAERSKVVLLEYTDVFGEKKRRISKTKKGKKVEKKTVVQKQPEEVVEKGKVQKGIFNLKDKFVNKERAKSRSGL